MCAAQGLDFRLPLKPGRGALKAHRQVRKLVGPLEVDRALTPDIEILSAAIARGSFIGEGND
jgi:histidine ammonia-lyase